VSYRHSKRLKRKLVSEGAGGLVYGNRGRFSPRAALNGAIAQRIIALSCEKYENFNDTHFTGKLNEMEDITVSRDTVKRLRRAQGIKPKKDKEGTETLPEEETS
jgi:transposase